MLETAFSQAKPEILTIDQECQFTSEVWTGLLKQNAIQISMDGKGRCLDNLYRERFRRPLKQEEIYLNFSDTVSQVRENLRVYMVFYNHRRVHQALDYRIPVELYSPSRKEFRVA